MKTQRVTENIEYALDQLSENRDKVRSIEFINQRDADPQTGITNIEKKMIVKFKPEHEVNPPNPDGDPAKEII